jgi:uncharacterized protein (DUF302 family)
MRVEGLTVFASSFDPKTTMNRLVSSVEKRGIAILARIDHATAAEKFGLVLRPTELLIFGNPRVGTALMEAVQTAGIDLPLKALVWLDADGKTRLGYSNPDWIAARHHIGAGLETTTQAMTAALTAVAKEATGSAT